MVSPSRDGVGQALEHDDADAAGERPCPRASASNARQCPSGDRIPSSWYTYPAVAGTRIRHAAGERQVGLAEQQALARPGGRATGDVEQAVFTLIAGPSSPSL